MIFLFFMLVAEPPTILVVRSESPTYETFNIAFERELEADFGHFTTETLVVERKKGHEPFSKAMAKPPRVLVMVDRWPAELYTWWLEEKAPPDFTPPPAILLYNVQIEKHINKIPNSTGIRFNIPAVTGIINLRSISPEIKRVGVLYRPILATQFERERRLAKPEGVELVGHQLSTKTTVNEIKSGLRALKRNKVQAYWLFNDPHMLTPELLSKAWIPRVEQYRIPVIVGVNSLMGRVKLGNLAIFPDIEGLAGQAFQIVLDLEDNEWQAAEIGLQHPHSVKKYFNRANWPRRLFINDQILNEEFDAIITLE
ncbi:hypothetical protein [Acanthopleuribacter pedis]|uniref:Uncharacterized protein n=1 Tax=Acanthopleuribacter pedis TaxID=442870 RepID=A0A8J7U5Z8_9BACT|nr:hypothetical protein [Acanthopleuribacter pedis]MBO1322247.1 hypothetical protein [Acanthopleuribacter pedis]